MFHDCIAVWSIWKIPRLNAPVWFDMSKWIFLLAKLANIWKMIFDALNDIQTHVMFKILNPAHFATEIVCFGSNKMQIIGFCVYRWGIIFLSGHWESLTMPIPAGLWDFVRGWCFWSGNLLSSSGHAIFHTCKHTHSHPNKVIVLFPNSVLNCKYKLMDWWA